MLMFSSSKWLPAGATLSKMLRPVSHPTEHRHFLSLARCWNQMRQRMWENSCGKSWPIPGCPHTRGGSTEVWYLTHTQTRVSSFSSSFRWATADLIPNSDSPTVGKSEHFNRHEGKILFPQLTKPTLRGSPHLPNALSVPKRASQRFTNATGTVLKPKTQYLMTICIITLAVTASNFWSHTLGGGMWEFAHLLQNWVSAKEENCISVCHTGGAVCTVPWCIWDASARIDLALAFPFPFALGFGAWGAQTKPMCIYIYIHIYISICLYVCSVNQRWTFAFQTFWSNGAVMNEGQILKGSRQ